MQSYYQLLKLSERATQAEIEAAYQAQHAQVAVGPSTGTHDATLLEQAYATLRDPKRRQAYDASLPARRHPDRTGLTRREVFMTVGGALVGLILIGLVWVFVGRNTTPSTEQLPIGQMSRLAPAFNLPGLDGKSVQLSDYRGKVVLVNFWGTWCEPCKEETPALQAAYAELQPRGLQIIGVNLYSQETGGEEAVRAFVQPFGVTYPIALDRDGETARAFQISPIPVSYLIDQNGTIRFVKVGTLTQSDVRMLFERLQPQAERP